MDLFELAGTIALNDTDKFNHDVDAAAGKAEGFGEKLKSGAATVAKWGAAAVAAGAVVVASLTNASVESYAQYEQLVGGVDTLFKDSSSKVQGYAANAYKTAGMSANAYMETVTGFSASLLQGLGGNTELAADVANRAITDMSDNANKMGSDITSIQTAYQGFAKQNYTMLDNLKLGYGGTQEEMKRLISDAAQMTDVQAELGVTVDESSMSFDNIINAISVMQTELGITGTTAREASITIEGSANAMKAAWSNLLTGLADENADINDLVTKLGDSMLTFGDNIIPRIEQTLKGIGTLIQTVLPPLIAKIPPLLMDILPALINAAMSLVQALVAALPQLIQLIVMALPTLIETLISGLAQMLPALITGIVNIITALANNLTNIIQPIIDNLPMIIEAIGNALINNLPALIMGVVQLVLGIVQALPQIIQSLIDALPTIITMLVQGITEGLPALIAGCILLVIGLVQALPQIISALIQAIPQIIAAIILGFEPLGEDLKTVATNAMNAVKKVFETVWNAIKTVITTVMNAIKTVITTVWNAIKSAVTTVINAIKSTNETTWNNIKTTITTIINAIKTVITTVWNAIKTTVSTVMDGIKTTISNVWNGIKTVVSNVIDGVKSTISNGLNGARDTVSNVLGAIKDKFTSIFDSAKNIVKGAIDKIKGFFNFSWELPKLKLPHFNISGKFSLDPPSIPTFSVSWYKKAMDEPYMFTEPTIFGYNPATGAAKGAGEAGDEVMIGKDTMMSMIGQEVANQNGGIIKAVNDCFDKLFDIMEAYFPEFSKTMVLDTGTLVASTVDMYDEQLGIIQKRKGV